MPHSNVSGLPWLDILIFQNRKNVVSSTRESQLEAHHIAAVSSVGPACLMSTEDAVGIFMYVNGCSDKCCFSVSGNLLIYIRRKTMSSLFAWKLELAVEAAQCHTTV